MDTFVPLELPNWDSAEARRLDAAATASPGSSGGGSLPLSQQAAAEADPEALALCLAALSERIPAGRLLSLTRGADRAGMQQYRTDALVDPPGQRPPDIAVLAASEADVRLTLQVAQHFRVPLYARGLGSGLSGGAIPVAGGIVLDLAPLDRLISVDRVNRSCVVEPGLTSKKLNDAVRDQGLWYPPRPASHEISSLGGNFAENAGGFTVVKYGNTKHWLLGARIALPGGNLITVGNPAPKDVAGLDLLSLLCGSEGLLGVATELTLRLTPLPGGITAQAFSFRAATHGEADLAAARAAEALLSGPVTPRVLEFANARAAALIMSRLDSAQQHALFGSVESGGSLALLMAETDAYTPADSAAQMRAMADCLIAQGAQTSGPAASREEAEALWAARGQLNPACYDLGAYKLGEDLCVPRGRTAEFIAGLEQICTAHNFELVNYGHIGDSDFHATLMFTGPDDPRLPEGLKAMEEGYRLAVALGGSITGEHGVGLLKAPYLGLQIGPRELELMREIKQCFDPRGILNPGKWL